MAAAVRECHQNPAAYHSYHYGQRSVPQVSVCQTKVPAPYGGLGNEKLDHTLLRQGSRLKISTSNKEWNRNNSRKPQVPGLTSESRQLRTGSCVDYAPVVYQLPLQQLGLERYRLSSPPVELNMKESAKLRKPMPSKQASHSRSSSRQAIVDEGFDMSCVLQDPLFVNEEVTSRLDSVSLTAHGAAIVRQKSTRSPVKPRIQRSDVSLRNVGATVTNTTTYASEDMIPARSASARIPKSRSVRTRAAPTPKPSGSDREPRSATPMPFITPLMTRPDHIVSQHANRLELESPFEYHSRSGTPSTHQTKIPASFARTNFRARENVDAEPILNLQPVAGDWSGLSKDSGRSENPARISEEAGEFIDIAALKKELDAVPSSVGIFPIILDDPTHNRSASEPINQYHRDVGYRYPRRKRSAAARIENAMPLETRSHIQAGSHERKSSRSPTSPSISEKPLPDLPSRHKRAVSSLSKYLSGIPESTGSFHVNPTYALEPKVTKLQGRRRLRKEYSKSAPDGLSSYCQEKDGGSRPEQEVPPPKERLNIFMYVWKCLFGKKETRMGCLNEL